MARILVVEDERKVLRSLLRGLEAEGYEVATAATGEEGYRLAAAEPFDCLVLDLLLPRRDGLQVLADLRRAGQTLPVLILTARGAGFLAVARQADAGHYAALERVPTVWGARTCLFDPGNGAAVPGRAAAGGEGRAGSLGVPGPVRSVRRPGWRVRRGRALLGRAGSRARSRTMSERIKQLACASLLPALFAGAGRLVFAQEGAHRLDADRIAAAAGTKATTKGGGVRI